MTPKAQLTTTTKIDKLDFMKIKNLSTSKDTTSRVKKKQPTEMKKIFTNCMSDKGLIKNIQGTYRINSVAKRIT